MGEMHVNFRVPSSCRKHDRMLQIIREEFYHTILCIDLQLIHPRAQPGAVKENTTRIASSEQ
jgi:hypothetical protein